MKNKILFLVIFSLATMAISTSASGQATHDSDPKSSVTCTNDALHPIAGIPYTYNVSTTPSDGSYLWWATTNTTFIDASTGLNNSAAETFADGTDINVTSGTYNSSASSNSSITISWGTDVIADAIDGTPTFLSIYYDDVSGCSDNLKVYQIEPVNGFTVDILNLNPETAVADASLYSYEPSQCYADVAEAYWDSGSGAMVYYYGINYLYYEVVAANFSNEWTPTFTLSGLTGTQVATIKWSYDNLFTTTETVESGTASTNAVETTVADTSSGVSIYVQVTVVNDTYEGSTDQEITLAVSGTNAADQTDVAADCSSADTNEAKQTISARPVITPDTGFSFE